MLVISCLVAAGYLYNLLAAHTLAGKALIGAGALVCPSIAYLGYRRKKPWKKLLYATVIFGGLFGFFFEFIQEFNRSYSVISRIFPKILDTVPPDNVLGHMLMVLFMLTFYEHFINKHTSNRISPRIKYGALLGGICIAITLILFYTQPSLMRLDYPYAYLGLIAILPLFVYGYRHPKLAYQLVLMMPFFFYLYLLTEILAVRYSWWIYPGAHYIGHVQIFSESFPFEELFFWMLLYAPAVTAYYKIFMDNGNSEKTTKI